MTRVAVLDDYQSVAAGLGGWETLPEDVQVVCFADHAPSADALVARLQGFAVVVAMRERSAFPRDVLERLPELRLLVTTGMRNASIDVAAAGDLGVVVCGTGGLSSSTPELTWGLILAVVRQIPQDVASVRAGGWQTTLGGDLAGRTLGVVGLGNLGARVARIGTAFGMDVVAWSENLTGERCAEVGVRLVSKDELLRTADVVTVHLQLSPRTAGLIGAAELRLMKPDAVLVNTSRGPIVEEGALADAVASGTIAGAGVDVFDVEPLPAHHPFRHLPGIVATPHVGYVSRGGYEVFFREVVEDIAAFLAGTPVRVLAGSPVTGPGSPAR